MTTAVHDGLKLTDLVDTGANPREDIDPKGEKFKDLVKSIEAHGVLQPILVSKVDGNGKFQIVAGYRRVAAATKAGLKVIPAMELASVEGDAIAEALTENLQRLDLTPIEEARALEQLRQVNKLKQADIAKQVAKSPAWVSERLALLKLPEAAQEAMQDGTLPVDAADPVKRLARQSEDLAKAVVDGALATGDPGEALMSPSRFGKLVQDIASSTKKDSPYLCQLGWNPSLKKAVPDKERRAKIEAKLEAIDTSAYRKSFNLGEQSVVDAAKSYGCLITVDRYGNGYGEDYATDPEWVADQIDQLVDKLAKEVKKEAKSREDQDEPDWQKAQRERQAQQEKEAEARKAVELELGSRTAEQFASTEMGLDDIRVLALNLLSSELGWDIAESSSTVEGSTDSDTEETLSALAREVLEESDVKKLAGLTLKMLARVQFSRGRFGNARTYYGFDQYPDIESQIGTTIDKWALDRKFLPQPLIDEAKERAAVRAKEADERQERGDLLLLGFLHSLGRAGGEDAPPELSESQFVEAAEEAEGWSAAETREVMDRLVSASQLSTTDASGPGLYTWTELGEARLEESMSASTAEADDE